MKKPLAILACTITLLMLYANLPFIFPSIHSFEYFYPFIQNLNLNETPELGAEYFMLAQSMATGNGFSDPFGIPTGPSAWMPPMYSFLLASLLIVFQNAKVVMWVTVSIKTVSLFFIGVVLVVTANNNRKILSPKWILIIYAVLLIVFFPWYFQSLHDVWLQGLLTSLILIDYEFTDTNILRHKISSGILGGLVSLASPALYFAWLITKSIGFIRSREFTNFTLVISLSLILPLAWTIRNYHTFGKLIAIKSNLFYELDLSSKHTTDGVYFNKTFKNHPFILAQRHLLDPNKQYIGESELINQSKNSFLAYLLDNPLDFIRRIVNRFIASTVLYKPFTPEVEGTHPITRSIVYSLPFCGFLILLINYWKNDLSKAQKCSLPFYIAYLLPYVIIAFYIRYWLNILPVLTLFIFWGIDSVYASINNHLLKLKLKHHS